MKSRTCSTIGCTLIALVLSTISCCLASATCEAPGDTETYVFMLLGDDAFNPTARSGFVKSQELMESSFQSGWNVPSDNITLCDAREKTYAQFLELLRGFAWCSKGGADSNDIAIFYYVGHGDRGKIDPNFKGDDSSDSYSYSSIYLGVGSTDHGEEIFIFDACHSGTAMDDAPESAWVMSSCTADQRTHNWGDNPTSFSWYLSDAISESTGVAAAFDGATGSDTWVTGVFEATLGTFVNVANGYFQASGFSPQMSTPEGREDLDLIEPEVAACSWATKVGDACWEFWEIDEELVDLYSPPWTDSKYRKIIRLNKDLLAAAQEVESLVRNSNENFTISSALNRACREYRQSPYTEHAELWLEGKISEGNELFEERNDALGVLFRAIQRAEEFAKERCPEVEIHPWSTHFN